VNIIHLDRVDSTNEYAKRMALEAPDRTVVVAEVQTHGKGRMNRLWSSPPGGLWMSVLLKGDHEDSFAPMLTLAAGIAVARALRRSGIDASLKWPNDILVSKKKLGGVLCEWEPATTAVVVGIGLNINLDVDVFPSELRPLITTAREELKHDVDRGRLTTVIVEELASAYERFKAGHTEELLLEWKQHSTMIGREVEVDVIGHRFQGRAVDLDQDGSLILREKTGADRKIIAGDVRIK
jgi:BirA family biotin operon repressor/biotin-[acetyl-CoA-carboxylase] ligase